MTTDEPKPLTAEEREELRAYPSTHVVPAGTVLRLLADRDRLAGRVAILTQHIDGLVAHINANAVGWTSMRTERDAVLARVAELEAELRTAQDNFEKASLYVEACDVSERDELNEGRSRIAELERERDEARDQQGAAAQRAAELQDDLDEARELLREAPCQGHDAMCAWTVYRKPCSCGLNDWRARVVAALKEGGT